MKRRLFAVAALGLLWASVADAGVIRFTAKRVVKPAAHVTKKVVKAAFKAAV